MVEWLVEPVVVAGIALMLAFGLRLLLARSPASPAEFPYQAADLFTPTERRFHARLEEAVAGQCYRILGKVRLADLINVIPGQDRHTWGRAFNRIKAKHIDFVLCRRDDLSVVCAVELDDRTHERPDRVDRDVFVDKALAAAGIPLVRVEVRRDYEVSILRGELCAAIRAGEPREERPGKGIAKRRRTWFGNRKAKGISAT